MKNVLKYIGTHLPVLVIIISVPRSLNLSQRSLVSKWQVTCLRSSLVHFSCSNGFFIGGNLENQHKMNYNWRQICPCLDQNLPTLSMRLCRCAWLRRRRNVYWRVSTTFNVSCYWGTASWVWRWRYWCRRSIYKFICKKTHYQ